MRTVVRMTAENLPWQKILVAKGALQARLWTQKGNLGHTGRSFD
ncbi:hypothetical protein MPNT_20179 [Candidatus Methylacidithermus pantelleriae]|uniref:Uncharacterized protein n=1 Tax=Candidatus Methylacidithermus pantelleriae TaxID=2744239 RepID=A0A8J2BI28_9BACT|nr:hypothetical protein MPNT_20179 [Candidatus Methylacidithermus pantelleriae]